MENSLNVLYIQDIINSTIMEVDSGSWNQESYTKEDVLCILKGLGYDLTIDHENNNAGYWYVNNDGQNAHTWDFEESIGE